MGEPIFANLCHRYWARRLSVVPLESGTKRPAKEITGWPGYLGALPSEATIANWLARYPDRGIGLLLGSIVIPDHALVALDVDDDRLTRLVLSLLGKGKPGNQTTVAGKRGKKGATYFVVVPVSDRLKSTVLKGAGGLGNIEVLAAGKQTVMPPSIHPETGRPYSVEEGDLLDTPFETLTVMPARTVKLLRKTIGSVHAAAIVSGEQTHEAGVALVASLVAAKATDEEIHDIFRGLLPETYAGNSLEELPGWIESALAKGFDDTKSERDGITAQIVELVAGSGIELFNDGDGTAYVSMPTESGGSIVYRVGSNGFRTKLRHLAYKATRKPVASSALNEAIATIESKALFDGIPQATYNRVAGNRLFVEIDLGTRDGGSVIIAPDEWRIASRASHKFVRGAGSIALANPSRDGSLRQLQDLLNLDERSYRLMVAFLLNAIKPSGPYFILLVEGEQGSGKSFFCEVIKRIIDPNRAARTRLPEKDQDLMIQAKEYWLLSFDNASGMKAEMSDALCSLSTGGGIAVRKLYTDGDLHVLNYARPFVINGIASFATRPDLMERAIPIKLSPMAEGARKTEEEMWAAFDVILPGVLGALYDAVSVALETYDDVEPARHLRMADSARWIRAGQAALDVGEDGLIEAISEAQSEFVIDSVNDDPLVATLRGIARMGEFVGYVGDLFATIDPTVKGLPTTTSRLSNQLRRLRPAMAKAGVHVEFLGKDRRGQKLRIFVDPDLLDPVNL